MSLKTTFDHQLRRGYATYLGLVNYDWLQEFMLDVIRHNAQSYPKLVNGIQAQLRLQPKEISQFLEFAMAVAQQWQFGPVAVVVSDVSSYQEVHTLGLLTEKICRVHPFWDLEAAEEWLNSAVADESKARAAAAVVE